MEKHKCKLCARSFSNGRALGGHMKGHLSNHPLPPPKPTTHQLSSNRTDSASSSSSSSGDDDEHEKSLAYGLRENPKKSLRFADPEFSFAGDSGSVVQDRESETESRNPTRRRSKRKPKFLLGTGTSSANATTTTRIEEEEIKKPPKLNLNINPYSLTHEQAISIVAFLSNESGSMVALSFFYWLLEIYRFKHFMRLYIVTATSLIENGNFDRANEVMQCLVGNFAEVGRLKEAIEMVLEMQNHGLKLNVETLNQILVVGFRINGHWVRRFGEELVVQKIRV